MLNNVTGDLQWDWVTHKNSKTMAVWCSGYDGFVCLWCLKSAHKHWHRDLPWTHPHKYRLVHIKLTSSLGYSLFHPPLPLSISSHTNVQANGYISTHWVGGGEKTSHVEFIKQFECDYANGLCLIHATVWTSGVRTDCDKLHSLTAVHVCSKCLWLLNCFKVWKRLHLYSSHTPLKVSLYKTEGNEWEKCICYFSANLQSSCNFFKLDIGMGT